MHGVVDVTEGAIDTALTARLATGDAATTAPGARFGRFVVLGALGRGGMGVVLAAVDPELERKVAIKLLHADLAASAHQLLQREAQAMARLAHPNVVTVYEVGCVDGQPFIAMELVDGTTLRAWLARCPRGWREIAAMFVAAGRGLVAAHAVGLVHRDFKPENVLIGSDGRPRVSDFGLATRRLAREPALDATAPLDASALDAGVQIGTPAYMAPEQWAGADTDARTDQFAFAVALWSAVFRERPFDAQTGETLRSAVLAGRTRRPQHPARAPRWLFSILARALAVEPERRWPSLATLLDAIERRSARRRTSIALAAGVAVAGLAISAAIASRPAAELCSPPDGRIARVWGSVRRAALAQHAAVVDPVYGAQRFAAAASMLDPGLAAWSRQQVEACRATRVDGTQSDHLLDLRMRCLTEWLDAGSRVASRLADARSPADVEAAARAAGELPRLEHCADAKALDATIELPSRPADRVESDAIVTEIKAIQAASNGGQTAGLVARADAAIARARKLDHPFALSRALGIRWRVAFRVQDVAMAVAALREQIEVAARAHDDEEAAKAWSVLLELVALYQGHPSEAKAMFPAARAAAARAGDPPEVLFYILDNESTALAAAGEYAAALAKLTEARRVLEAAGALQPGSPLFRHLANLAQSMGDLQHTAGQLDDAATSMRESLALFARAYGPDTREAGAVQLDLAQILSDLGQLDDAERAARASVKIRERGGQTPALAMVQSVLSDVVSRRGRHAEALELGERAIALARATMPPDDAVLAILLANLAEAYAAAGQLTRGLTIYDEVLATERRTGVKNTNAVSALLGRADIARRLGKCPAAIAGQRDAAQLARELEGDASPYVGSALRGEGLCLAQLGRHDEAIAVLERGLGFRTPATMADTAQLARGTLGRLLVTTGRDRARGKQLAHTAVARLKELGSTDPIVAPLAAWLATLR